MKITQGLCSPNLLPLKNDNDAYKLEIHSGQLPRLGHVLFKGYVGLTQTQQLLEQYKNLISSEAAHLTTTVT